MCFRFRIRFTDVSWIGKQRRTNRGRFTRRLARRNVYINFLGHVFLVVIKYSRLDLVGPAFHIESTGFAFIKIHIVFWLFRMSNENRISRIRFKSNDKTWTERQADPFVPIYVRIFVRVEWPFLLITTLDFRPNFHYGFYLGTSTPSRLDNDRQSSSDFKIKSNPASPSQKIHHSSYTRRRVCSLLNFRRVFPPDGPNYWSSRLVRISVRFVRHSHVTRTNLQRGNFEIIIWMFFCQFFTR